MLVLNCQQIKIQYAFLKRSYLSFADKNKRANGSGVGKIVMMFTGSGYREVLIEKPSSVLA